MAHELKWFTDSPDAGPDCKCSYCETDIEEKDAPCIRLFDEDIEARLHEHCFNACLNNGIIVVDIVKGGFRIP